MPEKVLMIALSPTMETGTLARWRKKEGDTVASGDVLCEVETDKATMDYESGVEGTLLKILLPEGGQAKVGDMIAIVGKPGEDISGAPCRRRSGARACGGTLRCSRGCFRCRPRCACLRSASGHGPCPASSAARCRIGKDQVLPACPQARPGKGHRPADRLGLGPRRTDREAGPGRGHPRSARPRQCCSPGPGDQAVPVSRMRQIIAKRLAESKFSAPHYYLTVAVGMDRLLESRTRMNEGREKKLSVNAFLMAIAGRILTRHPQVNSTWNGDTLIVHGSADVGLAVAMPDGLDHAGGSRLRTQRHRRHRHGAFRPRGPGPQRASSRRRNTPGRPSR